MTRSVKIKKAKLKPVKRNFDLMIFLVMETPENINLLSEFDQLLYNDYKSQIKAFCDKHNELISVAIKPKEFELCLSIETTVNELNDAMNDFLDQAFKDIQYIFDDELINDKKSA